ncbi:MAG: hypothetical protein NC307_06805 [Roseburia sp.]|nr:hypothetical protein [Roseburia sp.]
MKNSRIRITAVLFAIAVTLSGCGDALYELTAEEETILVNYAAQAVAKFNTYQQDGEVFVRQDVLDEEETEAAAAEPEESLGEEALLETDTEEPGETTDMSQSQATSALEQTEDTPSTSTMTEALDLGVVTADYMGNELTKTYMEEDYYAVDAEAGKQFLVVKYNLVNTSNQALHIDILAMTPAFVAVVNGDQKVPAQTTILLDDLSTYQSDIEVGGTNETVLLFQIPEDVESVSSLQLNVTMNGKQFTINL